MVSLSSLILACVAVSDVAAMPAGLEEAVTRFWARQGGGFYSSNWSDGGPKVQFNNKAGGEFAVTWNGKGNFVCGKGYNPGGPR